MFLSRFICGWLERSGPDSTNGIETNGNGSRFHFAIGYVDGPAGLFIRNSRKKCRKIRRIGIQTDDWRKILRFSLPGSAATVRESKLRGTRNESIVLSLGARYRDKFRYGNHGNLGGDSKRTVYILKPLRNIFRQIMRLVILRRQYAMAGRKRKRDRSLRRASSETSRPHRIGLPFRENIS